MPIRFGPLEGPIDEERETQNHRVKAGGGCDGLDRHTSHGDSTHFYRKRLSIRRSMDLSGQSIEVYSNHRSSIGGVSTFSEIGHTDYDYDEPDDLRASVVLELLLRAADVAHHLQKWESMTHWMSCLFRELLAAHKAGRGFDPRPGWFDNQVKIVEHYLMPLTSQLNEIGVFGEDVGPTFLENVEENLDRWMIEGFDVMAPLFAESSDDE